MHFIAHVSPQMFGNLVKARKTSVCVSVRCLCFATVVYYLIFHFKIVYFFVLFF